MAAGIQFNHVPFKGGADALQAVLGGHVDLLADSSSWAPHVESGKLALLATWGEQRTARFKDTPTLKELGLNLVQNSPFGMHPTALVRPRAWTLLSPKNCAMPSVKPWPARNSSKWWTALTRPCCTWTGQTTKST